MKSSICSIVLKQIIPFTGSKLNVSYLNKIRFLRSYQISQYWSSFLHSILAYTFNDFQNIFFLCLGSPNNLTLLYIKGRREHNRGLLHLECPKIQEHISLYAKLPDLSHMCVFLVIFVLTIKWTAMIEKNYPKILSTSLMILWKITKAKRLN